MDHRIISLAILAVMLQLTALAASKRREQAAANREPIAVVENARDGKVTFILRNTHSTTASYVLEDVVLTVDGKPKSHSLNVVSDGDTVWNAPLKPGEVRQVRIGASLMSPAEGRRKLWLTVVDSRGRRQRLMVRG